MAVKRALYAAGLLGGVFWVTLAFYPPECAPVTEAAEVLCNRLWSPALAGMWLGGLGLCLTARPTLSRGGWLGPIGLLAGLAMMFGGNFVEYWLLNDLPHQGPEGWLRGLAWMTVLLGLLVTLIAAAVVGALALGAGFWPTWLRASWVLLLPATVVAGFVGLRWAGLPLGVVSAATGLVGLLRPPAHGSIK